MDMTAKANRLLLIVDPQIDFITGTLPVPGAEKAMDALAEYVETHATDYKLICVTCDRHPLRHISFTTFGGQWPAHCIESSVGAAVWPPLMKALENHSDLVHFLYKGENQHKDEYSIFQNTDGAKTMGSYFKYFGINKIDICGLAGDVCVANTFQDILIYYPMQISVLSQFTASLDGCAFLATLTER